MGPCMDSLGSATGHAVRNSPAVPAAGRGDPYRAGTAVVAAGPGLAGI